jgi:hypothetical protein
MRRLLAIIAAVVCAAPLLAVPASADPGGGGDGKNFWVQNRVHLRGSGYRSKGKVNVPPGFDPPKCWYQPEYTYDEMMEFIRRVHFSMVHDPDGRNEAAGWMHEITAQVTPHEGEPGKIFWFLTDDGTDAGWDCYVSTSPFWKYVGATPPRVADDKIIDPVDLARLARANLTLPDPVIKISPPNGTSYVGLETWVGVPGREPVFVEAFVDGFPQISARIDAVPSRVDITTNGPGEVHDGKASCPVYTKGASPASGCWIRFGKSSLGARYTITVTQHWTVTTNVGIALPPGEVSARTTLRVDEIQSTVRK